MSKKLKNSIIIENDEYEINAVYSSEAGKVRNPLTLSPSVATDADMEDLDSSYKGSFDGSASKGIYYVPASGGVFTGPVYIDTPAESIEAERKNILNAGQVYDKIAQAEGEFLYTLDVNGLNALEKAATPPVGSDEYNHLAQYYKFITIVGTTPVFNQLKQIIAAAQSTAGLNFEEAADKQSYIVSGFTGSATEVVIPYFYNGKPVTAIKEYAFQNNKQITKVSIPWSVKIIQKNAFAGSALSSISIPDSVDTLGTEIFLNCTALSVAKLGNVNTINIGMFTNCSNLGKVILSSTVKSIQKNAFSGCSSLNAVTFGGDSEAWNTLKNNTDSGNDAIKNIQSKYISFNNDSGEATAINLLASAVNISTILDKPILYICKDSATESNRLYLKLPGYTDFTGISNGATRLDSTSPPHYYTYDTLATIIAGINSRLDALGSTTLTLPGTLSGHVLIPESESLVNTEVLVESSVVPTVQELEKAIAKICGNEYNKTYADNSTVAAIATATGTDSLKTLRDDLDQLATNVEYEFNGGELGTAVDYTNSRIDKLEGIELIGDVTGSLAFNNGWKIDTTVTDDSHNHTISNIDDLQTTIDTINTSISNIISGDTELAAVKVASGSKVTIGDKELSETTLGNLLDLLSCVEFVWSE